MGSVVVQVKALLEVLVAKIAASSSKFCVGDSLTIADLQVRPVCSCSCCCCCLGWVVVEPWTSQSSPSFVDFWLGCRRCCCCWPHRGRCSNRRSELVSGYAVSCNRAGSCPSRKRLRGQRHSHATTRFAHAGPAGYSQTHGGGSYLLQFPCRLPQHGL